MALGEHKTALKSRRGKSSLLQRSPCWWGLVDHVACFAFVRLFLDPHPILQCNLSIQRIGRFFRLKNETSVIELQYQRKLLRRLISNVYRPFIPVFVGREDRNPLTRHHRCCRHCCRCTAHSKAAEQRLDAWLGAKQYIKYLCTFCTPPCLFILPLVCVCMSAGSPQCTKNKPSTNVLCGGTFRPLMLVVLDGRRERHHLEAASLRVQSSPASRERCSIN